MAYKLVAYKGRNVLKISTGKETWAGPKQVYRFRERGGFATDLLALRDERAPAAEADPLLHTVMASGRIVEPHPPLTTVRDYCAAQIAALPEDVRRLTNAGTYPVRYSERLVALRRSLEAEVERTEVVPVRQAASRITPR